MVLPGVAYLTGSAEAGWTAIMDNAKSLDGYFSLTSIYDPDTNIAKPYSFLTILYAGMGSRLFWYAAHHPALYGN